MKSILVTAIVTVVFIVALIFIEQKRQESINRIELEYQQGLHDIGLEDIPITDTEDVETIEDDDKIEITISGEVNNPGTYILDANSFLYQAIDAAGGITSNADSNAFNISYILTKSRSIYIPKANNDNKISINTADSATLDLLPGIGSTLANRIIEYRNENGEFLIIEDIMEVEGIGESLFEKIKDYIKL